MPYGLIRMRAATAPLSRAGVTPGGTRDANEKRVPQLYQPYPTAPVLLPTTWPRQFHGWYSHGTRHVTAAWSLILYPGGIRPEG